MDTYENNIPQEENQPYDAEELEPQVEPALQEIQAEELVQELPLEDTSWEAKPKRKKASPFEDSPYMAYTPTQQIDMPVKPKKKHKVWKPLVATLLVACLVAGTCAITTQMVNAKWENRVGELSKEFDAKLASLEKKMESVGEVVLAPGNVSEGAMSLFTPSQVYAANAKSVVFITNRISSQAGVKVSGGSGFIITEDGYVVTNYHVVEGNGVITVSTTDGTEYPAKLIGGDDANDVALLKVEAQNLRPVILGSSAELAVGDQVAAIGNPLGELTSTMTVGYVSAKERDITTEGFAINMIQTDAAINSGNSGGPLFNMRGEVVGITTAKYSGLSSAGAYIEGVGFAIPIDDVISILTDLDSYKVGGYLGVIISDMNAEAANYYGIPVGAYVQEILMDSAAQRAGIRAKDIIVEVSGYEVRNVNGLTRALRHFKAGDEVTVVVYRGGREVTLTAVLDAKPAE